jgi:hypothetical protein
MNEPVTPSVFPPNLRKNDCSQSYMRVYEKLKKEDFTDE